MYLSSFNINTSSSMSVNIKSLKTIIMNDNREFILRAEKSGFRIWYLQGILLFPKCLITYMAHPFSYLKRKFLSFFLCGDNHPWFCLERTICQLVWIHWEFLDSRIFCPWILTLLIHLNDKISNSQCKLSYHCRICVKNGMVNS